MAQYAWNRGLAHGRPRHRHGHRLLPGRCHGLQGALATTRRKIVGEESYQSLGGNNVQNAVSRLNGQKADVIVTSTAGAFGALSSFVTGFRSLGNNTPILNSWAGDGTTGCRPTRR